MSRHFRTSILTVDRVGHAQEIVDVAEEELRRRRGVARARRRDRRQARRAQALARVLTGYRGPRAAARPDRGAELARLVPPKLRQAIGALGFEIVPAAPEALTETQAHVMRTLQDAIDERDGVAPSIRELMRLVGVRSTGALHRHLEILEERGWIALARRRARAISIKRRLPPARSTKGDTTR